MTVNWKVRFKNPVWWANVAASVVVPVLACFGHSWSQMTSWDELGSLMAQALGNPTVVAAVLVSLWNTINDPTTEGLSDSLRALGYSEPHSDSREGA